MRMFIALTMAFCLLIGCVGGCAGNRKAIKQLEDSHERLFQEVESLKRNYESLATAEETLRDLKARLDILEGKIAEEGETADTTGEGENDEATEEIEQLTARIEAIEAKVAESSTPSEKHRTEPLPPQHRAESPASLSQQRISAFRPERYDVQQSYREAIKDYRDHRYEQATGEFTEVLVLSPKSDLADNAQYWIGECYYALNNYKHALAAFEKVLTYPTSEKLDDAQLKIGYSYLKAGDKEEAVAAFKKVLSAYPDSEYRGRAEAMITSIAGEQ